jgi:serine/threonine-protein kinase
MSDENTPTGEFDPELTGEIETLQSEFESAWAGEAEPEPAVSPIAEVANVSAEGAPAAPDMAVPEVVSAQPSAEPTPAESTSGATTPAEPTPGATTPGAATSAEPMVEMPSEREINWWMWVAVTLLVALLGGGGFYWWWTTLRPVEVPKVVGRLPEQAVQTLNDAGLRLGRVSEVPTDAASPGTVVGQKPDPKTVLKPGDAVALVVAAPPEQVKVPDVSGQKLDDAQRVLALERLRAFIVESYDSNLGSGYVISQLPTRGAELPPGTAIALAVSKGPGPAGSSVPNVVGQTEANATTLIGAAKLQTQTFRGYDASVTAGTVMAQSPASGTSVGRDSIVQVLVSQGGASSPVIVPRVVGDKKSAAIKAVKARGLKAEVTEVVDSKVAKGLVISQMPPAGGKSVSGGTIGLLVSKGNLTTGAVPAVNGLGSAEASESIVTAGFKTVMLEVPSVNTSAGAVWAQYPPAGTTYTLKFPVICLIAKALY